MLKSNKEIGKFRIIKVWQRLKTFSHKKKRTSMSRTLLLMTKRIKRKRRKLSRKLKLKIGKFHPTQEN